MKNPFSKLSEKTAKRLSFVFIGLSAVLIIAAIAINFASEDYEITTYSMGSFVQQTVYGADRDAAAQSAANAVATLEDLISWRKIGSNIETLNTAGGSETVVDEKVYELLMLCNSVSEKSSGAFDVTIAPLSRLWNFDESPNLPSDSLIKRLLPYVDYKNLLFMPDNTVSLADGNTLIDLGAVGKGAACDEAVKAYEAAGVSRAVIAVGGSVGVYGEKPFGSAWKIAVNNPDGEGYVGELNIKSGFVSTSGSYEKYFEQDGVLYHHILDPSTGYPADSGLVSVTVLSSSGALSDALSTACFVLGAEKGTELLKEFSAEGIFITDSHQILLTNGAKDIFTLTDGNYSIYE